MHDIEKPITLEDLTNPDKVNQLMKSSYKKDSLFIKREVELKKFKKEKYKSSFRGKNVSILRQVD